MIYFYPHKVLRDHQLDTIRNWPHKRVSSLKIPKNLRGAQNSTKKSLAQKVLTSFIQIFPLVNIKLRPKKAKKNSVIYIYGGLILNGPFIVYLENPWGLVGFNKKAMSVYKLLIKNILLSNRCKEIRCMSRACRKSLLNVFGSSVYNKAKVHYPTSGIHPISKKSISFHKKSRLLFIGSQFEIKGGNSLIKSFLEAKKTIPNLTLDLVTHLPIAYKKLVDTTESIKVYSPDLSRDKIFRIMRKNDVLIHPSYLESFGMVIFESLANGLAIITNDVYATSEMVRHGINGFLLDPPITQWNGVVPNHYFMKTNKFNNDIKKLDMNNYVIKLTRSIIKIFDSPKRLKNMKISSVDLFNEIKRKEGEIFY